MALGRLSSVSANCSGICPGWFCVSGPGSLFLLLFLSCLFYSLPGQILAADHAKSSPSAYYDLSYQSQNLIASSRKRIFLASRLLTDRALGVSLRLAHYRGLKVLVVLGKQLAEHPLSLVSLLRSEQLTVRLVNDHFFGKWTSVLLTDDEVRATEAPFSRIFRARSYKLRAVSSESWKPFRVLFGPALFGGGGGAVASARSLHEGRLRREETIPSGESRRWHGYKAYTYGRERTEKPKDLPGRLPKATRWGQSGKGER
ncbi:MAG: hypothetical protein H6618_03245 [Deltaproteobacteria bacterium]|nr:hypothetical protein [Deltaproteobacteria bacterium]